MKKINMNSKMKWLVLSLLVLGSLLSSCKDSFENEIIDINNPVPEGPAEADMSQPYNKFPQLGAWLRAWEETDESWSNINSNIYADLAVRRPQVAVDGQGNALVVAQGKGNNKIYARIAKVVEEKGRISLDWQSEYKQLSSSSTALQYPSVVLMDDGQFFIAAASGHRLRYWSGSMNGNSLTFKNSSTQLASLGSKSKYGFTDAAVTDDGLILVTYDKHGDLSRNEVQYSAGRFQGGGSIKWIKNPNPDNNNESYSFRIKREGQIGNKGMRGPSISIRRNKNVNAGTEYRVLFSHHNGSTNYLVYGKIIDTGDESLNRDKGYNHILWKNKNGSFVRTTDARSKSVNPSGTNIHRSSVVLTDNDKFFLIYDNDNNKGRYITGTYDGANLSRQSGGGGQYIKLNLKGGVSRVSASKIPNSDRFIVVYHNVNKDEDGNTNNIKYNFYELK
ncbi:hypothetical protein [Xanthovirga aplysinae]|uniref:hypothetical protein n=1 Tax=Xanthovirga aplysinae TaxID=2529853 RepID=UPI0012BBC74C|nr:hypothetical protein [Xanthovirga aplysinae]MTI33512.1 hypothetical protein [Xanthovirga aplysinae]